MADTEPLTVNCPKCGSGNVAYSCEPDCCFNHVCGDCLANFQLITRTSGRRDAGYRAPAEQDCDAEADSCAPTAACANCQGLRVRSVVDGKPGEAVCLDCGSILSLILE